MGLKTNKLKEGVRNTKRNEPKEIFPTRQHKHINEFDAIWFPTRNSCVSKFDPIRKRPTHFYGLPRLRDGSSSFLGDLVLETRLGSDEIAVVSGDGRIGKFGARGGRVCQRSGTGNDSGGSGGADKGSSVSGGRRRRHAHGKGSSRANKGKGGEDDEKLGHGRLFLKGFEEPVLFVSIAGFVNLDLINGSHVISVDLLREGRKRCLIEQRQGKIVRFLPNRACRMSSQTNLPMTRKRGVNRESFQILARFLRIVYYTKQDLVNHPLFS